MSKQEHNCSISFKFKNVKVKFKQIRLNLKFRRFSQLERWTFMNNPQEIANLIRVQATTKKINVSQMFTEIGLSKSTLSNLDNGSMLKADSLGKIADYLDCSVDYLLGRTPDSQGISNNHINAVDIHGNNVQTIGGSEVISKRDKELLQKINSLSFDDYADIISYINSKFRSNI